MIGGLSMTELVIILGLALLLLGPDQLPSLAKSLGKGLRELRKATDDIKSQFEEEMVNFDEQPKRMLAPVPNPPDDPAAARAGARTAAASDDPAAARAAARRASIAPEALTAATVAEAVAAAPLAGTSAAEPAPALAMEPPAPSPAQATPVAQPATPVAEPAAPAGTVARDAKA